MQYLNKELLLQSINTSHDYQKMVEHMIIEVDEFCSTFHDDPTKVSGWGHRYFCQDDGGRLIYNPLTPQSHICEICKKEYTGKLYDEIWVYIYRNEAILNAWKSALLFKITGEKKYLDYTRTIIGFYSDHYLEFNLHNKEGKLFETIETMDWGCGRIMPQGLNESLFIIRLVNALEIIKNDLDEEFLSSVNIKLFNEAFKLLMPQVNKVHNIIAWNNSAIGVMGLFSKNKEMIEFAFNGTYNICRQIREGVTSDFFWYEGSIHYNFFTLEGIINLLLFSKLYHYEFGNEEGVIKNMLISAYQYAFDNHTFPNPNDGWPNINLKTYSYVYTVAAKIFGYDSEIANLLKNIENKQVERATLPLSQPYYYDNRIPLERLALVPDLDLKDYQIIKSCSKNFESSHFGILRNEDINVFIKYGHKGPSHAHPDKMTIEVMIGNEMLTRDLSNSGYGATLCNEWHRMTCSHNTVTVDGKNQVSMEGGKTSLYNDHIIKTSTTDVYSVPRQMNLEKMKTSMNEDEVLKYLVKHLKISEQEAVQFVKCGKNLEKTVEEALLETPQVNYNRKIELIEDGFIDEFTVDSNTDQVFDYFFHSEAELTSDINTEFSSLGFTENGFQHIKNIRKVNSTERELKLQWKLGEYLLESCIDLDSKELYIADTYDNPVTKCRTSLILRYKGKATKYQLTWKLIKRREKMEIKNFVFNQDIASQDLGNGITRKILAYNENIMLVEASFEKGAVGALHSHPHEQVTYIIEGAFEFTINGVKKIVRAGDSMYKQPNIVHGAVCLEKGKLLDVFTPHREDFLK